MINSYSAGNYQLIGMESTVRMVFPPGIARSGTKIHPRKMILPGITRSWKLIQTSKIKMCEKSSISGSASTNPIYCKGQL
jgi:hypothetical protein